MTRLAGADALLSLSGHRRQQVWDASGLRRPPKLLRDAAIDEALLELTEAPEGEAVVHDYATTGLTLRSHPLALLRPKLAERKLRTAAELHAMPNGRLVRYCGIVTLRQQPETANGTIFISLGAVVIRRAILAQVFSVCNSGRSSLSLFRLTGTYASLARHHRLIRFAPLVEPFVGHPHGGF